MNDASDLTGERLYEAAIEIYSDLSSEEARRAFVRLMARVVLPEMYERDADLALIMAERMITGWVR